MINDQRSCNICYCHRCSIVFNNIQYQDILSKFLIFDTEIDDRIIHNIILELAGFCFLKPVEILEQSTIDFLGYSIFYMYISEIYLLMLEHSGWRLGVSKMNLFGNVLFDNYLALQYLI